MRRPITSVPIDLTINRGDQTRRVVRWDDSEWLMRSSRAHPFSPNSKREPFVQHSNYPSPSTSELDVPPWLFHSRIQRPITQWWLPGRTTEPNKSNRHSTVVMCVNCVYLEQEPCCLRKTVRSRIHFDMYAPKASGGTIYGTAAVMERENSHFRRPHSHLPPPQQRTPTNIGIKLISPQTTDSGLIFAADSTCIYASPSILKHSDLKSGAPLLNDSTRKTEFNAKWLFKVIRSHLFRCRIVDVKPLGTIYSDLIILVSYMNFGKT